MEKRFEEVEHTADIAIRVWGRDLGELFANAAYGMARQMVDPNSVDQASPVETLSITIEQQVELEAYDAETLLVAWLGELLYLGEREECVFVDFDILDATPTRLRAVARGGPAPEHLRQIKAVTFSNLEIVRTTAGYETTVVFDV
jgi:SHS2 domain-containing protein